MLGASTQSLQDEILKDATMRTKKSRKGIERYDWEGVDFKLETAKEIDGEALDLPMSLVWLAMGLPGPPMMGQICL